MAKDNAAMSPVSGSIRIGIGYDVHELVAGRRLFLGGIEIPHEKGLKGHSDADVLLHAVIDAVLGALGKSDIGCWFPPTESAYKDADSRGLFKKVWDEASAEGWSLGNLDCVVMAEKPKLAPHMDRMRECMAGLFCASPGQVSVKATSTEKLGFVGREEGMAATAVVLLWRAGG